MKTEKALTSPQAKKKMKREGVCEREREEAWQEILSFFFSQTLSWSLPRKTRGVAMVTPSRQHEGFIFRRARTPRG